MKDRTWPLAFVLIVLIGALAFMFDNAKDAAVQGQVLEYFDSIVPALLGTAVGALGGFTLGLLRAKGHI